MNCRVCGDKISEFMTFGKMPIANNFLETKDFNDEYFFELAPSFCESCHSFQLLEQPDPDRMFHENYAFFSQTSNSMKIHFKSLANKIKEDYFKSTKPFIVELGSNDGILLKNFVNSDCEHLGVEPSKNVADEALKNNVRSIVKYFSSNLADEIIEENGKADVVTSANVMCHIPDINDVAKGISKLLKDDGVLIFEDPYLLSTIEKISYDQIYDEHVFLFSILSVNSIFSKFGLYLFDVEPLNTHGGSMRYYLRKNKNIIKSKNLEIYEEKEAKAKLNSIQTYIQFSKSVEKSKNDLINLLINLKAEKNKIFGYAATSKSTTVLNYCNIDSSIIEGIFDTTPIKHNKFSPGKHIPILNYSDFSKIDLKYLYNFAWNHFDEILLKEKDYQRDGGKWITHVPYPRIV